MWTNEELDKATYTVYHDDESKQCLNVGTIEIQGTAYQGPYVLTPVPPFGSLKNGDGVASLGQGVHVPVKNLTIAYQSRGFPSPAYRDMTVLHHYPNGDA